MYHGMMTPKLRHYLNQIGVPIDPPPSMFRGFVELLFWGCLGTLVINQIATVPELAMDVAGLVTSVTLICGAGARYSLLRTLRQLSRGQSERDRATYVRVVFSFLANQMFFSSTLSLVLQHLVTLLIAAVLIFTHHYFGAAGLIVSIYASDRVFSENIDFVSFYRDLVEREHRLPN